MKIWQRKKLLVWALGFMVVALGFTGYVLREVLKDKAESAASWESTITPNESSFALADEYNQNAIRVNTGTYIESIKEINLKACNFRVNFVVWYRWEGNSSIDMINNVRVYNASVNSKEVLKDYHNGDDNYQQVR